MLHLCSTTQCDRTNCNAVLFFFQASLNAKGMQTEKG